MRIAYNNFNTYLCIIIQFIMIYYLYTYRSKRYGQIILRLLTNIERKEVNKNYTEYNIRNGRPWFIYSMYIRSRSGSDEYIEYI